MADIELDFVEGIIAEGRRTLPSLTDLSERYQCSIDTLKKHSRRDKWVERREAFERRMAEVRGQNTAAVVVQKGADVDVEAVRIAQAIFAQVKAHLNASALEKKPMGVAALAGVTRTAREAHVMARLALRLPVDDAPPLDAEEQMDFSAFTLEQLRTFKQLTRMASGLPIEDAVILPPRGDKDDGGHTLQ